MRVVDRVGDRGAGGIDQSADRAAAQQDLAHFSELVWSGQIPLQILVSMKRAAAGYFLAAAVFIPLGIFMGLSQRIYSLFEVIVEMLRPVPPPVLIPLAMLFFGLEDEMKIFVIFFSCAWPILLNTLDGVRNIERVLVNTGRTFGLSRGKILWQMFFRPPRRRS